MPAPMARPRLCGNSREALGCGTGNRLGLPFQLGGVGVRVVGDPGAMHGELGKEHQVAAGGGRLLGERLDLRQIRVHLPAHGAEGDHANPHRRLSRSVSSNE